MRHLFLLIVTVFLLSISGKATHVVGGEIRYVYVADSVFDFYITYYRDCTGVPFANPSNATSMKCVSSGNQEKMQLQLVSITDISVHCSSSTSPCSPQNTMAGVGFEEHVYKARIDFTLPKYKAIFACGDIIVQTGQCCRTSDITTGPMGYYYQKLEMNIKKARRSSSPKIAFNPVQRLCCNQPAYLDFGANDVDGDSISYALVEPFTATNTTSPYSGGFNVNKPFSVYDPGGMGKVDPKANPPIGFYFDKKSGYAAFTPTNCSEASPIVVQMKEWRKNSSGVYELISTNYREVTYWFYACPINNAPTVLADSLYSVCDGEQLCFNIESDDKTHVPPPPNPKPADDTVRMNWNRGIPGATFTILNPNDRLAEARFCWTPSLSNKAKSVHKFTVSATDNHCPNSAKSFKQIAIEVLPRTSLDLGPDTMLAKPFSYTVSAGDGSGKYLWNNGDTTNELTVTDWGKYSVEVRTECDTLRDTIEISQSVSTRKPTLDELVIFPNPSSGNFMIRGITGMLNEMILYDLIGQEMDIEYQHQEGEYRLSLKNSAPGTYFLILDIEDHKYGMRLMVN